MIEGLEVVVEKSVVGDEVLWSGFGRVCRAGLRTGLNGTGWRTMEPCSSRYGEGNSWGPAAARTSKTSAAQKSLSGAAAITETDWADREGTVTTADAQVGGGSLAGKTW